MNDRVWMTGWFWNYDTKRAPKAHWLEFGHSFCGIVLSPKSALQDMTGAHDECKRCMAAIRRKP
jgi:hypothetical protein